MKRLILYLIIYAWANTAFSQAIIIKKSDENVGVVAPFLKYRILNSSDTTWRTLDLKEATIKPLSKFEAKFQFKSQNGHSLVIEWADNKIEYLEAFITNSKNDTCAKLLYNDSNGYQSPVFIKNQILILSHPIINETYQVNYKLQSHNPSYPICNIQTETPFIARFIKEYTWYGLLSGIVITVFALNILFFISQKESTYFWYALYTISLGVFQWSYTGVGFQWIWPDFANWNRYSYMISSFLMLSFQYIYLYHYTKKLNSIHKKYIVGVVIFRFIILCVTLWQPALNKWHLLLDFFTLIFQLWLMHKIELHKTLHGKLFITSIILLATSYLIFIAAYYQLIETTFTTYNAIAAGGILELIVGMLALALRYKFLNDEKNKLQKSEIEALISITELKEKVLQESREKERIQLEVNKELEIKIQERTVELAQKNNKLEELNNKLLDMSSQLDKQNWTLNKELTGDRLKLMWGKNISYEEFKLTFPSDKHIYRFIAELKWQDKYECKKCKKTDWIEGTQFLSRKCVECKYEESVTANTLFHGLKFPIQKALFISLHAVINRDTLTIKQLAEEIDLREATVWAFRKKTLERINKKGMSRGEVLKSLVSE